MARVLVVEDDDVTRLLLESLLRKAGHWVRTADSVEEAIVELDRMGVPDVLVTDIFMPGGNGLSLVGAFRDDPVYADVPVVFLSGRALPADVEAALAFGATYLTKPVSVPALTEAVDAAIASSPDALEVAVRQRLSDLGDLDDDEERALFSRLLTSFVEQAPAAAAAVSAALAAGDADALEASAHKLKGSAANLGAAPLARVCADLEERAAGGALPSPAAVAAALRREMSITCRVFTTLAGQLSPREPSAEDAADEPVLDAHLLDAQVLDEVPQA